MCVKVVVFNDDLTITKIFFYKHLTPHPSHRLFLRELHKNYISISRPTDITSKRSVDEILSDTLRPSFLFLLYISGRRGGLGVKCRGKKFTYPKCVKVRFPNLDSSRTISALARTSLELKNISMNLGLENSTFQHLGK